MKESATSTMRNGKATVTYSSRPESLFIKTPSTTSRIIFKPNIRKPRETPSENKIVTATATAEMGMEIETTTTIIIIAGTTTTTTTIEIISEIIIIIITIGTEATETTTAGREIQIHVRSIRMQITPTVNASFIIQEDKRIAIEPIKIAIIITAEIEIEKATITSVTTTMVVLQAADQATGILKNQTNTQEIATAIAIGAHDLEGAKGTKKTPSMAMKATCSKLLSVKIIMWKKQLKRRSKKQKVLQARNRSLP